MPPIISTFAYPGQSHASADDVHLQAPDLAAMSSLTRLELSYNQIKSLLPLATCSAVNLHELYVSNNKISSLEVRLASLTSRHAGFSPVS